MNKIKRMWKNMNSPDKNMRDLFDMVKKDRKNIFTPKKKDATIDLNMNRTTSSMESGKMNQK
jgi:hypothetical protein